MAHPGHQRRESGAAGAPAADDRVGLGGEDPRTRILLPETVHRHARDYPRTGPEKRAGSAFAPLSTRRSQQAPCAGLPYTCLLYTSDAADEEDSVDLGGRRIIKKKK